MFATFSIGTESLGLSGLPHERTSRLPCVQIDQLDKLVGYRVDKWFGVLHTLTTHPLLSYTPYCLSFLQAKLAMRRFYYGPRSGISTDSLSYTQVHQYPVQSVHPDTILLFLRKRRYVLSPSAYMSGCRTVCSSELGMS